MKRPSLKIDEHFIRCGHCGSVAVRFANRATVYRKIESRPVVPGSLRVAPAITEVEETTEYYWAECASCGGESEIPEVWSWLGT